MAINTNEDLILEIKPELRLVGEKYLNTMAAALDVEYGKGHVLLFGYQPQLRGQPMGTYRSLFNALLYANDIARNHVKSDDWLFAVPSLDEDQESKE